MALCCAVKRLRRNCKKSESVEDSALWHRASVLQNTVCSDLSHTQCSCSLEDLVDKCVSIRQRQFDLFSVAVDLVLLQWKDAWLNGITPIFLPSVLAQKVRACVFWSEEEGCVSLQGFGLRLYVSSEDEHCTTLICLVFSTVALLQISDSLFIFPLIVSLYLVLMSMTGFWYNSQISAIWPSLVFLLFPFMTKNNL